MNKKLLILIIGIVILLGVYFVFIKDNNSKFTDFFSNNIEEIPQPPKLPE